MNFEKLNDDIVIFKTRVLSLKERQEIIDEIYRIQDKLKPLGVADFKNDELDYQTDYDLVVILNYQYQLFALKFFKEIGGQPPLVAWK